MGRTFEIDFQHSRIEIVGRAAIGEPLPPDRGILHPSAVKTQDRGRARGVQGGHT